MGLQCPNKVAHKTSLSCTCPSSCINCKGKGLKAVGHIACDLSCPLHKNYHQMDSCTGDSSKEEIPCPMIIDPIHNSSNVVIPSFQLDEDDQVVFAPAEPACIDDSQPPIDEHACNPTGALAALSKMEKWANMTPLDFHALSHTELANLPPMGEMRAYQLGINLESLRSAVLNV